MAPPVIDRPPFQRLDWNEYDWIARVVLPEWAGFQTRLGPYDAVSASEPSDGTTHLRVIVCKPMPTPPSAEQTAAYEYLLARGEAVRDAILAAVLAAYPHFREEYLDSYDEGDEDVPSLAAAVPVIERPDQLRPLMGLGNLFLLDVAADGVAYVGFEFGCEWEEGHGLGVLTHRERIIEIGQAPTAFDERAALADAQGDRRKQI